MIRYTVVWDNDVESAFAEEWLKGDSSRRSLLTEFADKVDSLLSADPESKGMPIPDSLRILAVPLSESTVRSSVAYQIEQQDCLVRVVRLNISR